eukprot:574417-Pyramimonas_sp.AAC.1
MSGGSTSLGRKSTMFRFIMWPSPKHLGKGRLATHNSHAKRRRREQAAWCDWLELHFGSLDVRTPSDRLTRRPTMYTRGRLWGSK